MLPAVQLRVRKGDPPMRPADDLPWRCLLARRPTEETREWDGERVPPTVQNEAGYVPLRVEPGRAEQFHHLGRDAPLVLWIRSAQELHAPSRRLFPRGQSGMMERRVETQDRRLVRVQRGLVAAHLHRVPDVAGISEIASLVAVPDRGGDPATRKEAPVGERYVHHKERRVDELSGRFAICRRYIPPHGDIHPPPPGHDPRLGT